ncbi:hypothetical protein ACTWPB_07510 [Nocardia sp. IBHARD005]|uniref:hypothetical protein n=1 Tax=Nocardia sp. IBHARD005 TaxID=3457765 RepID=UPI004059B859
MASAILRRARKVHWCAVCDRYSIGAGDLYLVGTCFPSEDGMGEIAHPVQRECRECAERYGRGDRFTQPTEEAKTNA